MKLFHKKKETEEIEGLDEIPKKRRTKALKLLEEYKKGLIIKVDLDIDQKELMESLRKEE